MTIVPSFNSQHVICLWDFAEEAAGPLGAGFLPSRMISHGQGSLVVDFVHGARVRSVGPEGRTTLFSCGDLARHTSDCYLELRVTGTGRIEALHRYGAASCLLQSDEGLCAPGDRVRLSYIWECGRGVRIVVQNLTNAGGAILTSGVAGLRVDIGAAEMEKVSMAEPVGAGDGAGDYPSARILRIALFDTDVSRMVETRKDGGAEDGAVSRRADPGHVKPGSGTGRLEDAAPPKLAETAPEIDEDALIERLVKAVPVTDEPGPTLELVPDAVTDPSGTEARVPAAPLAARLAEIPPLPVDARPPEAVVPCFTPGTLITTPRGPVPVEELSEGDEVFTRDNGVQRIAWIGRRELPWSELRHAPQLRPVRIRKGSLGRGLPERDLVVSPQHRMLIERGSNLIHVDEERLLPAKLLVDHAAITWTSPASVSYLHLMFQNHEVIRAEGAWTESFQPSTAALAALPESELASIYDVVPSTKLGARPLARKTSGFTEMR